jgi:AraC-like DNA-binding protein
MSYFSDISFINITKRKESCYVSSLIENSSYSIEYIKKGTIFLATNGKRRKLTGPVVFWMLPGNTYQFLVADNKPVEHYWADFYGFRAERMLKSVSERIPENILPLSSTFEFEAVFENMIDILKNHPMNRRYEAVVSLERLVGIIYFSASNIDRLKDSKYDFITELAEEMKLFPMHEYDFKERAKQHGVSYHHFRRLFKDCHFMAPYDYLIVCRMEYATKILKEKKTPIKDIATLCGFDQISSFSRMFKRKIGISPAAYAKELKNR